MKVTTGAPPAAAAGAAGSSRVDAAPVVAAPSSAGAADSAADRPPRMRNAEPPFRYPPGLYARRAQGDVTLRLWIDTAGAVHPDSTRVVESSGVVTLDSAAVAGSVRLRFAPARRAGRVVAAPLLFPVQFRHPAGAPLASDAPSGTAAPATPPTALHLPAASARRP